jgi:hypothetical protein
MDGWWNETSGRRKWHGSVRQIVFRGQFESTLISNISTNFFGGGWGGSFGERAVHLLESSCGFWIVEILVRVVDSCKASVGALDLLISGCSLDLQRFIVVERCWRRHLANGWPPPNLNECKW